MISSVVKSRYGRTSRKRKRNRSKRLFQSIDDENMMIVLLKWMKCSGFRRQELKPAIFSETGRGLMANRSFKPGDTIVKIPSSLLITTSTVLRSNIGPVIKQHPELTPRQILCIFLLIERHKGQESFWNPYISQLPDTYTTPSYFTDEELNSLPQYLHQKSLFQIETVNDEFQKVKTFSERLRSLDLDYRELFTFEAFRWAWFVINTRSVYMDPDISQWKTLHEVDSYALAPFLDLLNHSAKADVTAGFNQTSNCYEIKTHNRYEKYDQVFICYGHHGNEKLLLEYGFVVPFNYQTTVHIPFELILESVKSCHGRNIPSSMLEKKIKFLKEHPQLSGLSELTCGYEGASWQLMVTLSLLCTNNNRRTRWQRISVGQEPTTAEELRVTQEIAKNILKNMRIQITEKIERLTVGGHYTLLEDFLKEQLHILDTSIKLLAENNQTV